MGKRNRRFIVSLSSDEKRQLAQLAASEGGLSQAAVLRWLLHRELRRRGLKASVWEHANGERTEASAESAEEVQDA